MLLRLIGRYLRAGVMVEGILQPTEVGTPQGGPASPLLANILLDDLDKKLERRGWRMSKTIASGVGNNAWLEKQGLLSLKTRWANLAPLRRIA